MNDFTKSAWEVVKTIVIAGAIVLVIRTVLFQPFLVSGASMEPNIEQSNYLIIDELTYRFRNPERGEVIIFRYPNGPATFYIKRIVGLPGEQVDVSEGKVKINNTALNESSYVKGVETYGRVHLTLGPDQYFVMGDNRANSYDSRSWGPLNKKLIVGRALIRLFPFTEIEIFNEPIYEIKN